MRNKILCIVFLGVILLIPSITLINRSVFENDKETGNLAEMSAFSVVSEFLDDIPIREDMAAFNTKLTRRLTGSAYINSTQVLLGKNEWLFLKETQADYEHTNCFTEAEKAKILKQLLFQREVFDKLGIEFVIYIAPNKATIYPENMPDTVFQRDTLSRAEDLIEYIRANSDIRIVYPKEELVSAKELAPVYYTVDTHWNEYGGYVGTQALLEELFGFRDKLDKSMIAVRNEAKVGDLATIGNVVDIYREAPLYSIDFTTVNTSLRTDKDVYFVGDSFSTAIEYYLHFYVNKVSYVHYEEFDWHKMYDTKPDILVWEIVERNVEKYLELMLADDSVAGLIYYGSDGTMLANTYTPDGYYVNENGQWIQ